MTDSRTLPPEALDAWAQALCAHFGLEPEQVPVAAVLDLTRDVATSVARPAAPLGAFVAGLAAGRSGGDASAVREALAAVVALATGPAGAEAAPDQP
ncbi:DUF6457 domain-containing protein [Microbacterium hominis]|uniref:Molybdopterin-guanine dinucleotide biosynthesis protein MobA n=1 Tax=Microbacterium hominis TaxID=162426 RepID=A0A7D4TPY9_9MICO|nr:DUF6457 domain-containing protein [Microbacterium hominis]QKJ18684.1 molybdopterin-guanine dinucleotide biosynthesis protein MobA [Microbacterium hominis]